MTAKIRWAEPPVGNRLAARIMTERKFLDFKPLDLEPPPTRRRAALVAWIAACLAVGAYVGYVLLP